MKRTIVLAAVVLAGCWASGVYAQDSAPRSSNYAHGWATTGANVPPGGTADPNVPPGAILNVAPAGGGLVLQSSGAYSRYSQMIKVCNLSQEQQKEIRTIEADRDKVAQNYYAENAEKMKAAQAALSEAYRSKDKDAIQKAMLDYRELMEPVGEFQKSAHDKVMAVLTTEQKAAWQENQVMGNIKAMFYRANLTDDQLGQLKAAYADLAKDKDAKVEDLARKLNEQARGLLTDEQKEAMKPQMWMNKGAGNMIGAPLNPAPNAAPGQGQGGAWMQYQNGALPPGASATGGVIVIGENGNTAGGTFVQEGAGSSVHIIDGPNGVTGTVTIHVEEAESGK
ncbi:MAG: hypothetical protein NTX87_19330 [Planctomycetota bacterium]|nr:hypothetical protein [Planctomycetota bacterium]